jgi:hypothetical protein
MKPENIMQSYLNDHSLSLASFLMLHFSTYKLSQLSSSTRHRNLVPKRLHASFHIHKRIVLQPSLQDDVSTSKLQSLHYLESFRSIRWAQRLSQNASTQTHQRLILYRPNPSLQLQRLLIHKHNPKHATTRHCTNSLLQQT